MKNMNSIEKAHRHPGRFEIRKKRQNTKMNMKRNEFKCQLI